VAEAFVQFLEHGLAPRPALAPPVPRSRTRRRAGTTG
jgi:hypothetical protein